MQFIRTRQEAGFTLIELMIVAPIVVLFIGTFIGLTVVLTGDSLKLREKNNSAYDVQAALNDMEASVLQSAGFLTTTDVLPSPQGKNDSTTQFDNVTTGQPDTLILRSAATTASPFDSNRTLIFTGSGSCNQSNPTLQYMTIFFVSSNTLYRRTILKPTPACATPWQRSSCSVAGVASTPAICKAEDEKLLENVQDIQITYYENSSSSTPLADSSAATATSAEITITMSKSVAGSTVSYNAAARATSTNTQPIDSGSLGSGSGGVVNPTVSYSQNPATPYTTNFQWEALGNATGYNIEYRVGGGAWVQGPQNTTQLTYDVVAQHRKQSVEFKLVAMTSAGDFNYDIINFNIGRWTECNLNGAGTTGWENYGSVYNEASFTKTSSGIVGLNGLVRNGTVGSGGIVCTLPAGFRPATRLIFQVSTYPGSASGRVDVNTNGDVIAYVGSASWMSLSSIIFPTTDASISWAAGTWQSSWLWWGSYTNLRYGLDSYGRAHLQGLGKPGTTASGTVIAALPTQYRPSHYMHVPSLTGNGPDGAVGIASNGNVTTRIASPTYQNLGYIYYPSTFSSWNTLNLQSPWANYSGTHTPAQCYRASDDIVVVRGLVKTGAQGSTIANTNTSGCGIHSDGQLLLNGWISGETPARIDIEMNGDINATISSSTWTSLDYIVFIAD